MKGYALVLVVLGLLGIGIAFGGGLLPGKLPFLDHPGVGPGLAGLLALVLGLVLLSAKQERR
jgi:hypothetical protein